MKKILYLLLIVLAFNGCTKSSKDQELTSLTERVFFESEDAAFQKTQEVLAHFNPQEKLLKIDNIEYHKAGDKIVAILFYHSNLGLSNVLMEKNYAITSSGTYKEQYLSSLKCSNNCGSNPCQVEGHFDNSGQLLYAQCTCSNCKMDVWTSPTTSTPSTTISH